MFILANKEEFCRLCLYTGYGRMKSIKIHTFGIVVMVEKIDLFLMINVHDKCR